MLVLWCCHMFLLSYYIIFMHFVRLTYWQDAQCQFPVFLLILLQKVTFENILGIGRKFTMIFYWINKDRSEKGDPGGNPQPWGGSHPRVTGGPRPTPVCAPWVPPRDALWPINHPRRENPNPRRIFPNTIQNSVAVADKFRGFRRSCSGTLLGRGSTAGAISINTATSRDEEGVVPHRGWGLYQ